MRVRVGSIAIALAGGALFLGCGSSKRGEQPAGPVSTTAPAATVVQGSPGGPLATPISLWWEPAPSLPNGLGSGGGPATWYVGNTQGNPLKTHTAEESARASELLSLINDQRTKAGLPLLQPDPGALRAAKAHAEDMAERNFFDHFTPEGRSPEDRLKLLGVYGQRASGENIAARFQTAQQVIDGWMASEGHRQNMLSTTFTHVGVGYATKGPQVVAVFLAR